MRYTEASRYQGIKATKRDVAARSFSRRFALALSHRRAFSLTEVLLAVFILAIGIISIDDTLGPVVAKHAMSVIRSKVKPEDFGTFEEYEFFFGTGEGDVPDAFFTRTQSGDWGWMRPGFLLTGNADTDIDETGAIDIFSHYFVRQEVQGAITPPQFMPADRLVTEFPFGWPSVDVASDPPLWGIPFSRKGAMQWADGPDGIPTPPRRIITQHERYYPMQTDMIHPALAGDPLDRRQPEYVWDCMFRRYNGRIQVAIFVYRVSSNDARDALWRVSANDSEFWGDRMPDSIELLPPLPVRLDFVNPDSPADLLNDDLYPDGPWDVRYSANEPHRPIAFVPGVHVAGGGDVDEVLNFNDPHQSWQEHRQWLLDQNNQIHRVVGQSIDDVVEIELSRPLKPIRMAPHWRNTVDPTFLSWPSPFGNWPAHSQIPAEYYADIPWGPGAPAPAEDSSYGEVATFNPDTDQSPSFFNWNTSFDRGVVTRIWYLPRITVDEFGNEWRLTPVYVTVKEL